MQVDETDVHEAPPLTPSARVENRLLSLRAISSLKEEILRRPTFFEHFDGAKVDWSYLRTREKAVLTHEQGWLDRQGVRLVVDFSPGLNFYPDLVLLDTLDFRYEESVAAIDNVLGKMAALGATDAVFCLHCKPENHCDDARADDRFLAGVRDFCRRASAHGITLHLQHHPIKWHGTAEQTLAFIDEIDADNLRFALNTGHTMMCGESIEQVIELAGARLGIVLVSAPVTDDLGQTYDMHAPVAGSGLDLSALTSSGVPIVFDADYQSWDEVYRDVRLLG